MLKTHTHAIIRMLGRIGNGALFITQHLLFSWIVRFVILPVSLIHRIFDDDTAYWNFNYRLLWWALRVKVHYITEARWILSTNTSS